MKKSYFVIVLVAFFPALAVAGNLNLPANLELVRQNSHNTTVLDSETGEVRSYYCSGEPKPGPGWKIPVLDGKPIGLSIADTCFEFWHIANIPPMHRLLYGDADRDGLTEVVGGWGSSSFIYEYSGFDSLYIVQDTFFYCAGMDYGEDSDGDSLFEYMMRTDTGMVLYESIDFFSLPINHVFTWNWEEGTSRGGFTDLDGDGALELSYKKNSMTIDVLRNIGDNDYELDYSINVPDSLLDNYYAYIYGDFDYDNKSELIWVGSMGRVIAFEYVEPNRFALVWTGTVSHYNSFWVVGPTDMDDDGQVEFVVMSASIAAGGYFYYFFEAVGDNRFEQVYVDSLPGDTWSGGAIELWDFDEDGIDELAVCSNYWVGIFEAQGNNNFQLVYLTQDGARYIYAYDTNINNLGEIIYYHGLYGGLKFMEYTPGLGIHGDINLDCEVTLADPLYLVNYLKGFNYPLPRDIYQADANGSCSVNGLDVTYFINYFHGGGDLIEEECQ